MERNQFDEELSRQIQDLDEVHIYNFDKEKVWRKSVGSSKRKWGYSAMAAAVVIIISCFLTWYSPLEEARMALKKDTIKVQKRDVPELRVHETTPSVRKKFSTESPNKCSAAIGNTPLEEIVTEAKKDTQAILAQPELLTFAPAHQSVDDTAQLKVTFKRGKPISAEPDVKVAYIKGKKSVFPIKISPWPDTAAYYVIESSHKRLNFKL